MQFCIKQFNNDNCSRRTDTCVPRAPLAAAALTGSPHKCSSAAVAQAAAVEAAIAAAAAVGGCLALAMLLMQTLPQRPASSKWTQLSGEGVYAHTQHVLHTSHVLIVQEPVCVPLKRVAKLELAKVWGWGTAAVATV